MKDMLNRRHFIKNVALAGISVNFINEPIDLLGKFTCAEGMRVGIIGLDASHSIAFDTKGVREIGPYKGYQPLLEKIVKFFGTIVPPVSKQETLEILAFIEAADISKKWGGESVALAEVMK
ncbi:hypothetical protein H8S90_21570 [Olivibacter sp. SDN3]|nr:hypothetical protein H8S90_21570 [Olivibacter sp. SDN3]